MRIMIDHDDGTMHGGCLALAALPRSHWHALPVALPLPPAESTLRCSGDSDAAASVTVPMTRRRRSRRPNKLAGL